MGGCLVRLNEIQANSASQESWSFDLAKLEINLYFCLQNSQVVSINWKQEDNMDLVSYLYREGEDKYIGYLKPTREDLATLVIVVADVVTRLQVIG